MSEVAFSSPAGTTKFPVSVTVNMPNNNTPYKVEIYVRGRDCSRCASRWTAYGEANTPCIEQMIIGSGYRVAIPRWAQIGTYNDYRATRTYNSILPDHNVPNSCSCTVPF